MLATTAELQKLIDIGIALSSETNLTRLLNKIVLELRIFTGADGGSLYLKEGPHLRFEVCQNETLVLRGENYPALGLIEVSVNTRSIAGYVAQTGEVLNIADVYELSGTLPYHFDHTFDHTYHYRTTSMLVLPLQDHTGEVVGVLQLVNARNPQGQVVPFESTLDLVRALASLAAVAINNARLVQTIAHLFEALMMYSVSAIDARSPHTAGHSRRVAGYALALAAAVNACTAGPFAEVTLTEPELEELRFSAWLHDIGKIGVADHLLNKEQKLSPDTLEAIRWRFYLAQTQAPNDAARQALENDFALVDRVNRSPRLDSKAPDQLRQLAQTTVRLPSGQLHPLLTADELANLVVPQGNLTPEEYAAVQGHVLYTINILKKIPFSKHLARVPRIAAAHHERLDGSGYPFQLTAPDLPLPTRILAIADIFDALTARDRPYRRGASLEAALHFLEHEAAAGRLDRDLVELFMRGEAYRPTWEAMNQQPEPNSCCHFGSPAGPK